MNLRATNSYNGGEEVDMNSSIEYGYDFFLLIIFGIASFFTIADKLCGFLGRIFGIKKSVENSLVKDIAESKELKDVMRGEIEKNNLEVLKPIEIKNDLMVESVQYNRNENDKQWDRITPLENSLNIIKAEFVMDREENKQQHKSFLEILNKIEKTSTETNIAVAKIMGEMNANKK